MSLDLVCSMKTGGFCQTEPTFKSIEIVMRSTYNQARARKLELPIIVKIVYETAAEELFIAKFYGRGEQVWTVGADRLDGTIADDVVNGTVFAVAGGGDIVVPLSCVLRRVAMKGMAIGAAFDKDKLVVHCFSHSPVDAAIYDRRYACCVKHFEFSAKPTDVVKLLTKKPDTKGMAFGSS